MMLQSTLSSFEVTALSNTYIKVAADHSNHKKDAAATKGDNNHRKTPLHRQRYLYTSSGTLTARSGTSQHIQTAKLRGRSLQRVATAEEDRTAT
jgi:hypothetical protein